MKNNVCKISLISLILACATTMPVNGAVKTKNSNRSYANGYQQVNAMRYQQEYLNANAANATTASATANLPVAVDDQDLANAILNNQSTTSVSELEACSMIYPNGLFKWAVPESGALQNREAQCVAVVELRDANTKAVLATTTVAAGDKMKCNIDSFPEYGFNTRELTKVELPADAAPTEEDVIAVMNQEQRQNAGIKIAAGAIIAGVAGNLLAPKEAGAKTGKIPLGTGNKQLVDTAIGAAAGAGIMAASSFSGKVAGDTIKSTAVNAASGMIIGNMLAGAGGGDSVLATTRCKIKTERTDKTPEHEAEYDCIIGKVAQVGDSVYNKYKKPDDKNDTETENVCNFLIMNENAGDIRCCRDEKLLLKIKKDDTTKLDNNEYQCKSLGNISLVDIYLETEKKPKTFNATQLRDKAKYENEIKGLKIWKLVEDDSTKSKNNVFVQDQEKQTLTGAGVYYKIESASLATNTEKAYAVITAGNFTKKAFGYKVSDYESEFSDKVALYYRNYDGSVGSVIGDTENWRFTPMSRDAEDGGLIDLSNEARAKGTLVGTATGGALGGLAGYQGAKDEITERLLSAQREYEGSLTNFVCATGGRFLSPYNDYVEIPSLGQTNE